MNNEFLKIKKDTDRIVIVLFKFFRLIFVKTDCNGFKGISIIIGIWRIESQFNISFFSNPKLEFVHHEHGQA